MIGTWATARMANLAAPGANSMSTGPFGSSISSRFFRATGVPVIRGGNLSADPTVRLRDEGLVFLDPEKAAEFSRSTVRRGDLIFTCWGTINQIGLIDESAAFATYVISNKQMKLTPDPSVADSEFLYYLFSAPPMQREILDGAIGSSIPGFNLSRLRSLEVELPPLTEQRRIARALSDAEQVERRLAGLIVKKQAVKQGLMQQLLTGRTRLPGFVGDWTVVTYRDLVRIERGAAFKASEASPGPVPVIAAGRLPAAFTNRSNRAAPVVTISASGASAGYVAYHAEPIFASDCSTISPSYRADLGYIYYSLVLRQEHIYRAQAGGAQPHVHAKDVYPLEVAIPPSIGEQRAIAAALRNADSEIGALQHRLEKARSVRTGMMQQLLTGKIRLPVAEAVA